MRMIHHNPNIIIYICIYFQVQRYEGASTIYGPHTLDILLNKYDEFTRTILTVSTYFTN